MSFKIKNDPEYGKKIFFNGSIACFVIGFILGPVVVPVLLPMHPSHGLLARIFLGGMLGGQFLSMVGMAVFGLYAYIFYGLRKNPIYETLHS